MEAAGLAPRRSRRVELHCFGSGEFLVDGEPVSLRTRKTLALLAYLALDPGPHPRESVAELLWPEAQGAASRENLRTALSYLRQALGSAALDVLIATRDTVGVAHGAVEMDVDALRQASRLSRNTHDSRLRRQLRSAVDQYHGSFLADLVLADAPDFEAWLESQRAHWRGVAAELLSLLATMQAQAGEPGESLAALEQWVAIDPDDELAWRRLMEMHLDQGNLASARVAWQAYRRSLKELDASPSQLMSGVYQRLLGSSVAAPSQNSSLNDLDFERAPFVGRPREWAKLQAAYQRVRKSRREVVVIAGPAGVGKSRLASEFVAAVDGNDADVITGRSLQGIEGLPYAPVIDALRSRLEEENAPDDLLGDLWLTELARLLPELLERYPDLVLPPADALTRGRIFEAVSRLCIALGRRAPVVIVLDDMQWADQGSWDLLQYATQRWAEAGTPVLLVVVVESPLTTDVERWIAAIEAQTRTTRIELASLPPGEVTELVAMLAGSKESRTESLNTFSRWLTEATGGRPRPVIQTLQAMLDKGLLHIRTLNDSRWAIDLPDSRAMSQFAVVGVGH